MQEYQDQAGKRKVDKFESTLEFFIYNFIRIIWYGVDYRSSRRGHQNKHILKVT